MTEFGDPSAQRPDRQPGTPHPGVLAALADLPALPDLGRGARATLRTVHLDGADHALKVLAGPADDREVRAFRRDGALLAGLSHPGLPRVHEAGVVDGRPYLVMELVGGRSLRELLADGPLDEKVAVRMAADVAAALDVAHRTGLVHGDVRPDNIMISPAGTARLTDVGPVVRSGDEATAGTVTYSAPERTGALRRPVDGRADLYALGVVLFEALCGRPPFRGDDAAALIDLHRSAAAPDVRGFRPDASADVAAVIARLLAKDPDDRYTGGAGLSAGLRRIAAGSGPGLPPDRAGADVSAPVGRAAEAAQLRRSWLRAAVGDGGTVLVRGPAGCGKSRLVADLAAHVRGSPVLYGAWTPDESRPLGPIRTALERYARDILDQPEPGRGAATARVRAAAGAAAALVRTVTPGLAELLPAPDPPPVPDLPTDTREQPFVAAVAAFLTGLARQENGLLLVLDDAHRCDDVSRQVIDRLRPQAAGTPLLVVLTARDDPAGTAAMRWFDHPAETTTDPDPTAVPDPAASSASTSHASVVRLGRLDDAAVAELAASRLGAAAPPNLITRLALAGDGNPFAVLEYLRAVLDSGVLRPWWGRWVVDDTDLDGLALPVDVAGVVLARVDALGRDRRVLLTTAAVIGTRFHLDLLAEVAGSDRHTVLDGLTDAVSARLVEADPSVSGGGYRFVHDRIPAALLDALGPEAEHGLHERVARVLDARGTGRPPGVAQPGHPAGRAEVYALARHSALGSTPENQELVFRSAVAAGELALGEHAAADAVGHLTRAAAAAAEAGITPDPTFLANLGLAGLRAGGLALAEEYLTRALAVEPYPVRRAELYRLLAVTRCRRWRGNDAVAAVVDGLAALGHRMPTGTPALVATTIGRFVGGLAAGVWPMERAGGARRERYRQLAELSDCGARSAAVANRPRLTAAFDLRALFWANRLGSGSGYAGIKSGLAVIAALAGRRRRAHKIMDDAAGAVARSGDAALIARMEFMHGLVRDVATPTDGDSGHRLHAALLEHGRWLDAGDHLSAVGFVGLIQVTRGHASEALDLARHGIGGRPPRGGDALGDPFALLEVRARALLGDAARAAAGLGRVRRFLVDNPNTAQLINVALAAMQLAVEEGDTGDAFDRAVAEFDALAVNPAMTWSFHRAAWVYRAFGRVAQAAAAVTAADIRADQRLAAAESAVTTLRKAANGPLLRAYATAGGAALRQLRGDNRGALRQLARLSERALELDAPLIDFETARVRSRALHALGRRADSRRVAEAGHALAVAHGWTTRARWMLAEFDLFGAEPGTGWSGRTTVADLREPAARRERDLAVRLRISAAELTATLDPDEVLRRLLANVADALPVDRACVVRGSGTVAATCGAVAVPAGATVDADTVGQLGPGLRHGTGAGRPEPVSALLADPQRWLSVGLTLRGAPFGVLIAGADLPGTGGYGEAEVEIAAALAGQGMIAYDNACLFRQVGELAVRDGLTGLFNRRHFEELADRQVSAAQRYVRPLAALMIDVDRLEAVNDAYGRPTGDAVIAEVARRLSAAVRTTDLLCRYGGEEFAVLLMETGKDPNQAAERLREAVTAQPVHTAAGALTVTVSIGAVELDGTHADAGDLLAAADTALHEAKRTGRNRVVTAPR